MNKSELQDHITSLIVAELEKGTVPWHKGWRTAGLLPSNLISGKAYRGINALVLSIVGANYSSPYWLTYKQAQQLGGSVKLGEKGTHITYYSKVIKKDKDTEDILGSFGLLKGYVVFNADQCEGIQVPVSAELNEEPVEILPALESIKSGWNCPPIYYREVTTPFYSPTEDSITLPTLEQFESAQEHAYTLAHEIIHSTGHQSRCDRWSKAEDKASQFGCKSYAREELVAEIGACMVLTMAGIEIDIKNSGAYIKSWLKALNDDSTLIFKAAAKASSATSYILGEVKEEAMA